MIRPVLLTALVLNLASAEAFAAPTVRMDNDRSLTAQIDGFHGASGTGKSVQAGSAGVGAAR
ncbi:hypothetical protein ANTHELSMS3_04529 [Antarctobacter heliothermus]|uniref:Uncharacterized protein n=1 Tax=Antarctobacter heliothermus TaxID=74033 RepID=A0A222EAQ0_9RHOB|nr:hypothetical protein [Antarctobacter heliothermus]ASP23128.1 hypothetical protein ANTHELSMS3_04529 [Antarctobacter heliothermus]